MTTNLLVWDRAEWRAATLGAWVVMALALPGCANRWKTPATETPVALPAPSRPVTTDPRRSQALIEFEARHRDVVDNAGQRGRWAEVMWSFDVLQALYPEDASLPARRQLAEQAAQSLALERMRAAKQAQQRGDAESAQRAFLEVLALRPSSTTTTEASEALRALERERVARQHLGVASRSLFMRPASTARGAGKPAAAGRNELEHASMLAAQGDTGAAISILKPVAMQTSGRDPAAMRLLADLYLRQADALWPQQRAAAITAAENGLQADPGNKTLQERLKLWKGAASATTGSSKPAPLTTKR